MILPTEDPYTESSFCSFQPVSIQCVKNTIFKSSQKTCSLDPIPTSLFFECLDQLLPAVAAIINKSLQTGVFYSVFKEAIVIPLLKKQKQNHLTRTIWKTIGPSPIFHSCQKSLKKIVLSQLSTYLNANMLLPVSQSAYRPGHSIESALLKLMNDVLRALDNSDVSLLTLLDLTAAFDTIDHNILLQRLERLYGISGTPLSWFRVYLSNRT